MKDKYKKWLAWGLQILLELILSLVIVMVSLYILNIKPHHMTFNFRVGVILSVIIVVIFKIGRGIYKLNQYNKGCTTLRGVRHTQQQTIRTKILISMRQFNRYLALGMISFMLIGFTRANIVDLVKTTSRSMWPTVSKDEYVLIDKVRGLHRFDVVMFQSPDKRYQHFLKRIVGLPGDTIEFKDDKLILNGRKVTEEYLVRSDNLDDNVPFTKDYSVRSIHGSNLVPDGMVFVMGDSRRNSRDSRIIGFVPIEHIVGRAVAVRAPNDPWYKLESWRILEDIDIYGVRARTKNEINQQESGATDDVHGKQE